MSSEPRHPMSPEPSFRHMQVRPSSFRIKLQSTSHAPHVLPSTKFAQLPLQHPESANGQTLPHALQLSLSVMRLMQRPLQQVSP